MIIEQTIQNYLTETLSVPVYTERPATITEKEYVIIQKTGASITNKIETSTLAIQSYSDRLYDAAVLNARVKDAMCKAVSLQSIAGVKLNSDANFSNTATKQYRYQAVFLITHY